MKDFRYIDGAAILRLNEATCIGCGNCAVVCPHRVFALQGTKAAIVDADGCMECGACAANCAAGAIHVNPDDGCGCAALIINGWLSRFLNRRTNVCGGC